jgi:hypothetical protein
VVDAATETIASLARTLGAELRLIDGRLVFPGGSVEVGDLAAADLRAIPSAFPSRAHGDVREKLVYKIVQDGSRLHESDVPEEDVELLDGLESALASEVGLRVPSAEERAVLAGAMRDTYWTRVTRTRYLVPYHAVLPANFAHSTRSKTTGKANRQRYKLFTGDILAYLCWEAGSVDAGLIDEFFRVFDDHEGFTLLDDVMYGVALSAAGDSSAELATAGILIERYADVASKLEGGAFCQPALDRFQRDLRTLLSIRTRVPRRDMVDHLTALLSLHLALLYYRVAAVLGIELDHAIAASAGMQLPASRGCDCSDGLAACTLAGRIAFRVGTRSARPVRESDRCAVAHREVDQSRLLALPAVVETANIADRIWQELGGPPRSGGRPRVSALARACEADSDLRAKVDLAAAAIAALYALKFGGAGDPSVAAARGARRPGLFALREVILDANRSGLRHTSRDVVNQLASRESGGSLITRRGRVYFFEIDEEFLFLLVTLSCQGGRLAFDRFLGELRDYGLAPQDADETDRLAGTLERLGLLRRYSDAEAAMYVEPPYETARA